MDTDTSAYGIGAYRIGAYQIGDWLFSPDANELRRGETRRGLEHRAARTLELLCRRRGEIVSQDEIVREVWGGRAISANSVPVVIRDLRQALGDDARDPRCIVTHAKRGYRLLPEAVEAEAIAVPAERPLLPRAIGLLLVLLVAGLAAWSGLRTFNPPVTPLFVTEVENATGEPRFQPQASAASEVLVANARKIRGARVFRGEAAHPPSDAVRLSARLIIWKGRPTVTMLAQSPDGPVLWMGMTSGYEELTPREIAKAMDELGETLRR